MRAFFVRDLERRLNPPFICGSASGADNAAVTWLSPPRALSASGESRRCAAAHWLSALVGGRALLRNTLASTQAWALSVALAAVLTVPSALASERQPHGRSDHERARAAVQAGEVLPLPSLLERLQRTHPGQVLELELEREDGRWIYEVKLLQANGQLLKLELDGGTGQLLKAKLRESRKTRPEDRRPAAPAAPPAAPTVEQQP
jgi:uncharacterized membrane protein YkoI